MSARPSPWPVRLSVATAVLSTVAVVVGVAAPGTWSGGRGPVFTTTAGTSIELFGRGLYRHDGLLAASTFLGTDLVTLALMVPLLGYALMRSRRTPSTVACSSQPRWASSCTPTCPWGC